MEYTQSTRRLLLWLDLGVWVCCQSAFEAANFCSYFYTNSDYRLLYAARSTTIVLAVYRVSVAALKFRESGGSRLPYSGPQGPVSAWFRANRRTTGIDLHYAESL